MALSGDLHVFDSCVWIELIEHRPEALGKIIEFAQVGAIKLGAPDVVVSEIPPNKDVVDGQKKRWSRSIEELRKCARLLHDAEVARFFARPGEAPVQNFNEALNAMLDAIKAYRGDSNRDWVIQILNSRLPVRIPAPKALNETVVNWGLQKKKPFGTKNSTADTMLLFSLHRWAQRNTQAEVHFYTFNIRDFSAPDNKRLPHPDIEQFFAPATNLQYHTTLEHFHAGIKGLDPSDFYPEPDFDRCAMCDGPVPIEDIYCDACGAPYESWIDEDGYTLKAYRSGYLVDADGRLSCGECGRRTFQVELASLCSYHQHVVAKDD